MKNLLRYGWLVLLCAGCVATAAPEEHLVHIEGHWTLGAVFSIFYTLDRKVSYVFDPSGLPPEVNRRLSKVSSSHPDFASDTGEAKSVYLEFDGVIFDDPTLPRSEGDPHNTSIRVVRLYKYGPPHKDYLRFRASR